MTDKDYKELCICGGKCDGPCREKHLQHGWRWKYQKDDLCPCLIKEKPERRD